MTKFWSKQEESDLISEFGTLSIDDISKKHNRSVRAIELRLQDIATKMYDNDNSEESLLDILNKTGVNKELILKRKKTKEREQELKTTKSENKKKMIDKLSEIYDGSSDSGNSIKSTLINCNVSKNNTESDKSVYLEVKQLRLETKELRLEIKELKLELTEIISLLKKN